MKKYAIIFILSIFSLQGCIKEDISICKSGLSLKFRYTLNNHYSDRFKADVDRVTVYIFDSNGKYVGTFSQYTTNLEDNTMSIPLPRGKYSVVAYGGDLSSYNIDLDDVSKHRLTLKNATDTNGDLIPINSPNDLYAGFTTEAISSLNGSKETDIELIKDTKTINIEIYNQSTPLDIQIRARNGKYAFDNSIDNSYGIFKYTPTSFTATNNNIFARLKIMRLVIGNPTELTISDPTDSKIIYKKDLIDQILLHPEYSSQTDLDREDDFLIKLYIKNIGNNIDISVSINGWVINHITPDTE